MKYLGQITNDEDIVNKKYVDNASEVVQTLTSGTKIGSVGGTDLYAPSGGGGGSQSTWWGTSSTSQTTVAKVVTCEGFTLTTGAVISVHFSTANTADAPTLNVNSTGAKTVYRGDSAVSATNPLKWSAGDTLTFMYDGTNYRYISSSSDAFDELTVTGKATLGAINGDSLFAYTSISVTTSSISANASGEATSSASTLANHYPLAITDVNISTGQASLRRFYFSTQQSGKAVVKIGVQNDGTSAKTISATAKILWVKTSV